MPERLQMRRLWAALGIALSFLALLSTTRIPVFANAAQATITLNPNQQFQTINGWEATAQASEDSNPGAFQLYKDTLYDAAVNDLGINRLRLEIRRKGPNGTGSGFDLEELDHTIETIILPIKQRLEARGEKLWVSICVVRNGYANAPSGPNGTGYDTAALEVMNRMKSKYGFLPDSWEIALEPDNFQWGGPYNVANAHIAAAKIFKANGLPYQRFFVIPSNTDAGNAIHDFGTIMGLLKSQNPPLDNTVRELAYHRYGGASFENIQTLGSLGQQYRVDTAMLEHIGSGYQDLYQDLTVANNSAWQQFVLAYSVPDDGSVYYRIDLSNPNAPKVILTDRARYLRQYFRYVRSGAVRIGAQTTDGAFSPVAFINSPNNAVMPGKYAVIVNASRGGSFDVQGLPAGRYGIRYTTAGEDDKGLADVQLTAGQTLNTSIPAAGVLTIYGKSGGPAATATYTPTPTKIPNGCSARPQLPELIEPENSEIIESGHVQLHWDRAECADKYKVMIRMRKPKGRIMARSKLQTTNFVVDLRDRKKYVWRVKACNSNGCAASPWQTFKVRVPS